jgi:hypothetical protein
VILEVPVIFKLPKFTFYQTTPVLYHILNKKSSIKIAFSVERTAYRENFESQIPLIKLIINNKFHELLELFLTTDTYGTS